MKTCKACGTPKAVDQFHPCFFSPDKRMSLCRDCFKEKHRRRREDLANTIRPRTPLVIVRASTRPKKRGKEGYVYLIKADRFYKIGQSINPTTRAHQLNTGMPFDAEIVHTHYVENMDAEEQFWHARYAQHRVNREWFSLPEECVQEFCSGDASHVRRVTEGTELGGLFSIEARP